MLINGIDLSGPVRGLWLTDRPWPFRRGRAVPPRPCFELRARKRPRKTRLRPYLPPYFILNYLRIKEMLRSDPEIISQDISATESTSFQKDPLRTLSASTPLPHCRKFRHSSPGKCIFFSVKRDFRSQKSQLSSLLAGCCSKIRFCTNKRRIS